jgi:hypothetical protein
VWRCSNNERFIFLTDPRYTEREQRGKRVTQKQQISKIFRKDAKKSIDTALSRSAGWAKEKIGGNGKKK